MNRFPCDATTCVHYNNGSCVIKDPERYNGSCLDYEDIASSLRLKINFKKGTLHLREE